MAAKIIVQAADVWAYWLKHKDRLYAEYELIAENEEFGITVELSTTPDYHAEITVYADGDEVRNEVTYNSGDCNSCVLRIYNDFCTGNVQGVLSAFYKSHGIPEDKPADASRDRELQIENREEELHAAVFELLTVTFTDTDIPVLDAIVEEVTDELVEYLYRKYKFPVYRPMVLEDDAGEFFEEYPYEHMVFEGDAK